MSTSKPPLMRAVEKHRAGRFDEAERIYRRLLQREPTNGEVLKLLGALCGATGRPDPALHFLGKAAQAMPDDPGPPYNRGNVLRQQGRLEDALSEYETATRLAPHHASAQLNRGVTCLELGRREEAIGALRRAVDADPAHLGARYQLAVLLLERDECDEAAEHLRFVAGIDSDNAEVHLNLGLALHGAGRLEQAAEAFETATRLDGDRADAWCNLGGTLRTLGRSAASIVALQRALQLDDTTLAAHTNLALAHLDRREAQNALNASRTALTVKPDHAPALRTAAAALALAGEFEAAEEELRRVIELEPDSSDAAVELGDVLCRLDRFDEAEAAYRRAEALDADGVDARIGRVMVRRHRGETEKAVALAEATLNDHPDRFAAVIIAAELYLSQGRSREAIQLLGPLAERSDLTAAQRRRLHFRLGAALDGLGEFDAAWEAYTRANDLTAQSFDREALARRVEAITNAFRPAELERLPRAEPARPAPIFIVGMPRSGTTLVEQILSCHEQIVGGGELYTGGRTAARIADEHAQTSAYPACLAALDARQIRALADSARAELARIAGDRPIITDKSPQNLHFLGMLELLFPEARVIVCQRDPRDTCLSCWFCDFAGAHPYAYDLEDLGYTYRMHERLIEHWRGVLSLPTMTIQYEQLVDDQPRLTRQLLEFCDLPWSEACLEFHRNPRAVHTASAEQVRRPIYRSSIGRYRHYERHLAPLFEALEGELSPAQPAVLGTTPRA
ncbi:MAG: tetratricopeptide repeat protein [Planctomycetota bacterium]|nr:tetratricopeptide repeat protein [Planctomycetota bacterium]